VTATGGGKGDQLAPLSPTFKRKMRETIIETEGAIFEGILTLGRGAEVHVVDPKRGRAAAPPQGPTDPEARLLYTLSSFHRLTETAIPAFMRKVSDQLGGDAAAVDSATLEEMIESMDELVYSEYVAHRSEPLCDMMRSGVVGVDWASMPPPTEVRGYMHRVVLLLVDAHARVGDSAPALVDRVIETLIDSVCDTALGGFKRAGKFGTGGMLTATLEIEFLNQCVTGCLSPNAKSALSQVFNIISQGYGSRRPSEAMQRDMENMRKILEVARRGVGVEILCFRKGEPERRGSRG
jgi:exocyst complex component 2